MSVKFFDPDTNKIQATGDPECSCNRLLDEEIASDELWLDFLCTVHDGVTHRAKFYCKTCGTGWCGYNL